MIFGKIEYLNLLPFHMFMKRYLSTQQNISMDYYKGVPANINQKFQSKKVDAGFISSIKAKNHKSVNLGIIAKKEVLSVLVIPNKNSSTDKESATSNILAKVLDVKGEVLIGDKALKYYLASDNYIDLASLWHKRYKYPFVFAVLCYHNNKTFYKKIEKQFLKQNIKIPQYLLQKASLKTSIPKREILKYLKLISYNLDTKSKKGLKIFYNKTKD